MQHPLNQIPRYNNQHVKCEMYRNYNDHLRAVYPTLASELHTLPSAN